MPEGVNRSRWRKKNESSAPSRPKSAPDAPALTFVSSSVRAEPVMPVKTKSASVAGPPNVTSDRRPSCQSAQPFMSRWIGPMCSSAAVSRRKNWPSNTSGG